MRRKLSIRCAVAIFGVAAAGCGGGTDIVTPPPPPSKTIVLEFRADPEDRPSADALGWGTGVPGVTVTVFRADASAGVVGTFTGSSAGTLSLPDLPGGEYVVEGVRWLTAQERARLPQGDDAVGFLSRVPLSTTGAAQQLTVSLVASRRRGLIISEFRPGWLEVQGRGGAYYFTGYLRLYNNSDSVIYLDRMVVGEGFAWQFDFPNFPCSLYAPIATDPLGIWSAKYHQLPGSGTQYPLAPGETTVLATDAIDHRPMYPFALDLRQANFELFAGGSDVDNPSVPNAMDVGLRAEFDGHGLYWSSLETVAWIARPLDLAALHIAPIPSGSNRARIPADALVDVMAIKTTYNSGYPDCLQLVNSRFDRKEVKLISTGVAVKDDTLAYKRRQLPFTINGRTVLQHTRTSALDFTVGGRTPFAKP